MPKVSVIVPVYGVEKYIERCARTLFEQTIDSIEYLFIDDCTPDNSIEVLKQVLEDYPDRRNQVIIHRMERNSGQAEVRKWGLQNATGDYIIQCDSDDWVDCDMYKNMYEAAINQQADVVICDFQLTNGDKYALDCKGSFSEDWESFVRDMLYLKTNWVVWNKLFRREKLLTIETYPTMPMGEDIAIVLQLLYSCRKIAYLNKVYYFYFINDSSITKKTKSDEVIVSHFFQTYENVMIAYNYWKSKKEYAFFIHGFDYLFLSVKDRILSLSVKSNYYRRLWKETFPKVEYRVLFDNQVSVREKIRIILIILNLYSLLCRKR